MSSNTPDWPVIHSIGDVLVQGGYLLGPRTIDDFELVYFPDPTQTIYELEGVPLTLDEPCFILTRPGASHLYRFDPDSNVRHMFVHFDYAPLLGDAADFAALRGMSGKMPAAHNPLVAGLMRQILRTANFPSSQWKRHVTALLAAALEELRTYAEAFPRSIAQPPPIQIRRAIEYMDERLREPITIEEIARQSGWTHSHFTRVFVASLGVTPKRALLERRLLRAEGFMLRGEGTVKQIAHWVGFDDEHHFSKIYKRIRGYTASEYIERCRDPLFCHTASVLDPDTPYPINCHYLVNG